MIVCIFSFNRGQFLQHCVESIERCAPNWRICVFDDDSNDPATLEILEKIRGSHQVVRATEMPGRKHGGLYGNMQTALESFRDEELMLYLQDDMQLVRSLSGEDEKFLRSYFNNNPKAGFVQPCFLKGSNRSRDQKSLQFSADQGVYFRDGVGQSAGVHYSDILIASPKRLSESGWHFSNSEPENDRQAAQMFGKMGHLHLPIAMWLPEVPAYRGKRKTLALKIAEKRRQCGLYPFEYLSKTQEQQLRERSPTALPFAEDFLENVNSALEKPWVYYPLQGSRWLKKLNSLELSFRRLIG